MKNLVLFAFTCFCTVSAVAQDAVPAEILQRTILIRVGNEYGSAFAIDYQGKIYLVTARHLVAGLPRETTVIQIFQADAWRNYEIVRILFPPSEAADIAVLETKEKREKPFLIPLAGKVEEPTMGQQVWFLGYPFGIHSHVSGGQWHEIPFIKKGTMSRHRRHDPQCGGDLH